MGTKDVIQAVSIVPGNMAAASRLNSYGQMFDLYHINMLKVHYRPTVGTSQPGKLIMGVDYDSVSSNTTTSQVLALRPGFSGPLYIPNTIVLDPARLNKQRWIRTFNGTSMESSAGTICWVQTTVDAPGDVWIEYDITFTSPRLKSVSSSVFAKFPIVPDPSATGDGRFCTTGDLCYIDRAVQPPLQPLKVVLAGPGYYGFVASSNETAPGKQLTVLQNEVVANANKSGLFNAYRIDYDRATTSFADNISAVFYLIEVTTAQWARASVNALRNIYVIGSAANYFTGIILGTAALWRYNGAFPVPNGLHMLNRPPAIEARITVAEGEELATLMERASMHTIAEETSDDDQESVVELTVAPSTGSHRPKRV
jgi:hypothetical protein